MHSRSNYLCAATRACAIGFLIVVQLGASACQRHADPAADVGAPIVPPPVDALPALALSDQTPNLLLTWVGDDGDFHVVEQIGNVPAEHRKQVRVVLTDQTAGTGTSVYVANLEDKRPDGTYAVSTSLRTDWEKLGADRRKSRLEALAPGNPGQPAPPATDAPQAGSTAEPASAAISAIVYGADWCKPCHDAERYLKSLGVSVTKKNIEESRAAQAEMREKLSRVNRSGAGIPVIDVMGKIFVGYSPGPLKQAVDAARHASAQKRG
jgi:glutaredoxin